MIALENKGNFGLGVIFKIRGKPVSAPDLMEQVKKDEAEAQKIVEVKHAGPITIMRSANGKIRMVETKLATETPELDREKIVKTWLFKGWQFAVYSDGQIVKRWTMPNVKPEDLGKPREVSTYQKNGAVFKVVVENGFRRVQAI